MKIAHPHRVVLGGRGYASITFSLLLNHPKFKQQRYVCRDTRV
jgi:hypothetical protein